LLDRIGGLDRSAAHAVLLCLHLDNTLLLLAAPAPTAKWLSNPGRHFAVLAKPCERIAIGLGLVSAMAIGTTGSLASPGGHNLSFRLTATRADARLVGRQPRPVAPQAAPPRSSSAGLHVCLLPALEPLEKARSLTMDVRLGATLTTQIALGAMNVILLAPIWLQMTHLLVAELFWMLVVLASAELLLVKQQWSGLAENGRARSLGVC
jgi:cytochrome c oxidase assembly protein subunit 15